MYFGKVVFNKLFDFTKIYHWLIVLLQNLGRYTKERNNLFREKHVYKSNPNDFKIKVKNIL